MARKVNGHSTILKASRKICKMVNLTSQEALASATTPEFALTVFALVVACKAFEALDNSPGEIDDIPPDGPEDNVFTGPL